jgi:hypothetical protein
VREAEAAFNEHLQAAQERLIAYIERVLVGGEDSRARQRARSQLNVGRANLRASTAGMGPR